MPIILVIISLIQYILIAIMVGIFITLMISILNERYWKGR